jgi:hypothetical protein
MRGNLAARLERLEKEHDGGFGVKTFIRYPSETDDALDRRIDAWYREQQAGGDRTHYLTVIIRRFTEPERV